MKKTALYKSPLTGYSNRTYGYMTEDRTFGKLVSGLSLDERRDLLDKFRNQSVLSKALLYDDRKDADIDFFGDDYENLSWLMRMVYKIQGLFKGKSPRQLFDDRQVIRVGKIINSQAPGFYDYRAGLLLPEMYENLVELRDAARFFYRMLDQSINKDKEAFYAFLASLEMGDVHQRLVNLTNPEYLASNRGERELRQLVLDNLDNSLHGINENEKSRMYSNVRALSCLKALAAFLFDRLLLNFSLEKKVRGFVCTGRFVKDMLLALEDVLFSLKQPPSMALLESLFIFNLQNQQGELNSDIAAEMQRLLAQAENSLEKIRAFNRNVPLLLILRCMSRNMRLEPKDIGGGEDWFVSYRDYWRRRIDEKFHTYIRKRRYENLIETFNTFFKSTPLNLLENAESPQNPEGFPLPNVYSLSCLKTFFQMTFVEDMNQYLSIILLEGIFFRKEKLSLFTESYNDILKVGEIIQRFENQIAPGGDYGKSYFINTGKEMTSQSIKQRRSQAVLAEAVEEAERIVSNTRKAVLNMSAILGEIIDSKIDTPVNLSYVSSKSPGFLKGLTSSVSRLQQFIQLLDTINTIEDGG
jgi:hypothetical protein